MQRYSHLRSLPALFWKAAVENGSLAYGAYANRSLTCFSDNNLPRFQNTQGLSATLRTVNTAAATVPDALTSNSTTIEQRHSELEASPSASSSDESVRFRSEFAHFLRDACASPQRSRDALDAVQQYLQNAKLQLEQHGKTQVSEVKQKKGTATRVRREHSRSSSGNLSELKGTLTRLALVIQNMEHLMVHTKARDADHCTHQLFRRYMSACRLTNDVKRARSAWNALIRIGKDQLLQDVDLCMLYVETLLSAARNSKLPEECILLLDDAIRELTKWKMRPAGLKGRIIADGHLQDEAIKYFTPHQHSYAIGQAYRDVYRTILYHCQGQEQLLRLHGVLSTLNTLRGSLAEGEPVPSYLQVNPFHAHETLARLAAMFGSVDSTENNAQYMEELLEWVFQDLELHMSTSSIGRREMEATDAYPQHIDEGLVQQLILLCERTCNSRLAVRAFSALERTTSRFPVLDTKGRETIATEDPDDGQLRQMLRLVGRLDACYDHPDASPGLEGASAYPIHHLSSLAKRIGRSPETWKKAWQDVVAIDNEGGLRQVHLNLLIASLAQLPDGAVVESSVDSGASPDTPEQGNTENSIVKKAAELHALIEKCFDGKLTVQTYNALLSVFCRPHNDYSQYVFNLLKLMEEKQIRKSFYTFELLLGHWSNKRVFGGLLATVEDMIAANMRPRASVLFHAAQKAEAAGMHPESRAIKQVLDKLGYSSPRRHQRPVDERGRVIHHSY